MDVLAGNHQGVAAAGSLRVTARSSVDGLIEAAEDPARRFCVSVQWHPELMRQRAIFDAFLAAARQIGPPKARSCL